MSKSFPVMLLQAGIVISAASVFAVAAEAPHVLLLTLAGVAVSLVIRRPVRFYDRSVIYSLVVVLVVGVGGDYVIKIDEDRFGLIAGLMGAKTSTPTLLYLAVAAMYFKAGPRSLSVVAACSVLALLFGGDLGGVARQSTKISLMTPLVKRFDLFYSCALVFMMSMLALALMLTRLTRKAASAPSGKTYAAFAVRAAALCAVASIAFGLESAYERYESELRKFENYIFKAGARFVRPSSNAVFNKSVDLGRTISADMEKNAALIVLRAVATEPPGYLRGRVYTRYSGGRWDEDVGEGYKLSAAEAGGALSYKTFRRQPQEEPGKSSGRSDGAARVPVVSVYPSKGFRSDVLLVPGNGEAFELVAESLGSDKHGVLAPDAWEKDGGCVVRLPAAAGGDTAFQGPAKPDELPGLKEIPENLRGELEAIMREAGASSPQSDAKAIAMVTRFFSGNFKYSLKQDPPEPGVDPVVNFLRTTRAGHCELFATSAVLLLRLRGISARYVTGFVCDEKHPSGRYYVSRLGNAHAWAEAYDRERGVWVTVEATPADGVSNFRTPWGLAETWIDYIKQVLQEAFANARRGHFAEMIVTAVSGTVAFLWKLFWHPARGGALIVILVVAVLWSRSRLSRSGGGLELDPATVRLQRELVRLERLVVRRGGRRRMDGETLREWARRVGQEQAGRFGPLPALASVYESLRYRSTPPNLAGVAAFRSAVDSAKLGHVNP